VRDRSGLVDMCTRAAFAFALATTALLGGCTGGRGSGRTTYGTVASRIENADTNRAAGLGAVTYEVYWDRLQPFSDRFSLSQFDRARDDLATFRDAGMQIVLDLGLQYPPSWAFTTQNSRYVNQYGDAYTDDLPGSNGLNAVFNQQVRDLQAAYVDRVFEELGSDFYAVRLGWGYYGELSYPGHTYADRVNAYWAFDDVAQGLAPGLSMTLMPNPVPGWIPRTESQDHASAREFLSWYLDALTDYQNWQIATVRRHFDGQLAVLYPSWGVRPGQLEPAIATDLSGLSPPEQNGELQRGHDFARHIASLEDRKVIAYTTWLDASPSFGNETGDNPAGWSPAHYLAQLAEERRPALQVWGENTGSGTVDDMQLCFNRLDDYGLKGLFWAFESQLYATANDYASIDDYATLIDARASR